jgi:hypothetical protein
VKRAEAAVKYAEVIMRPRLFLLASLLVPLLRLGPAMAQVAPPPAAPPQTVSPQTAARLKEAHHRFDMVATRAVANFRSANSIEERLRADGATLHPQLIALRLQIEAALDEAEAALARSDVDTASKATDRAEGLLERFARRLGGD